MNHDADDAGELDFGFAHLPTLTPEQSAQRKAARDEKQRRARQAYVSAQVAGHDAGACKRNAARATSAPNTFDDQLAAEREKHARGEECPNCGEGERAIEDNGCKRYLCTPDRGGCGHQWDAADYAQDGGAA